MMDVESGGNRLQAFRQALQQDRLIKIYIADVATPYLIPQSTLTSLSEYFVAKIKHKARLGGAEDEDVLRFTEDDPTAWEVLLWWKSEGDLSCLGLKPELETLVHCYILGDRRLITKFQDLIMLDILNIAETELIPPNIARLAGENTPPNCHLRRVMARAAVSETINGNWEMSDLEQFDNVPGFLKEFAMAHDLRDDPDVGVDGLEDFINQEEWREFMVGMGPKMHWAHDRP